MGCGKSHAANTMMAATAVTRARDLNAKVVASIVHGAGIAGLPAAFDGFTLLHLTDLHADLNPPAVLHVLQAQRGHHVAHQQVFALTGLVPLQRLQQITFVLPGKARIGTDSAVAVFAMAAGAYGGFLFTGLRIAPGTYRTSNHSRRQGSEINRFFHSFKY